MQSGGAMVRKLISMIDGHYWASLMYIILSFGLGLYLLNGLVLFLGWNMVLATTVFALSHLILYMDQKRVPVGWIMVVFGLYVLFFPNAIYIMTDFIHLEVYDFFTNYPSVYAMEINDWLVMAHIIIGALIAMKLGMSSIMRLEQRFLVRWRLKPYKILLLSALFGISSIGIYIGRFLRFNSWDILRLSSIITTLFEEWKFMIVFVIIFTVIQWVSYLLFANRTNNVV
jgi:uncharacterized membrane protein